MKPQLAFYFFFLLYPLISSAQYRNTSYQEATDAKKKILLVALEEDDPAQVNKLKNKPEELKALRDFTAGKNEALKNAIQKIWTFSKYEFMNRKEAEKLISSKSGNYSILKIANIGNYTYVGGGSNNGRRVGYSYDPAIKGYNYNPAQGEMKHTGIVPILSLISPKEIMKVNLPKAYPSEGEMIYAIGHLQYILSYIAASKDHSIRTLINKQLDEDIKFLKVRTLLIDKDDLKEGVTEDEIKENYSFPIKIVPKEEIDKTLIEKTSGFAVLKIIPVEVGGGNIMAHIIADTEDSKFYYFDYVKAPPTISGIKIKSSFDKLKEKDFRNISKSIEKSK